jgi:Rrf2 family protein
VLRISDAVNLAFHAMMLLAANRDGRELSVQELSRRLDVSDNHLSKVMQRLAKAGIVKSKRGPKGGFYLARAPEEIRLIDVYEPIEGALPEETCLLSRPLCDGECCLLGALLHSIQRQIREHLTQTTLDDVSKRLHCDPSQ